MNHFNATDPFHQQPWPLPIATASSASTNSDSTLSRHVILSTVLGSIVAVLFAYIGYLHRAQWQAVLNRMRLQIASRKDRIVSRDASKPDNMANRLDALEKALHNPTPPFTVNRRSGKSPSRSSSVNRDLAYDVRPISLLDMASLHAGFPCTNRPVRQQGQDLSGNGTMSSIFSSPCDPLSRSRPSLPAAGSISSSHPTMYQHSLVQGSTTSLPANSCANYDDSRAASPLNYLMAGPPSLSLSFARDFPLGGKDSLEEDSCVTVYQPSSPLPSHISLPIADANCPIDGNISPVSFTHTPDSTGPNTPLTPAFDNEVGVSETQRGTLENLPLVHVTMEDMHEDIKRAYSSFLSMIEDGAFDTLSPSTPQTRLSTLHSNSTRRISQLATSPTKNSTRWTSGTNGEMEVGQLNSRFISMLLQDLASGVISELDMPYPSAPSSTLGGHLSARFSQVQDTPVDNQEGMEHVAHSTAGTNVLRHDFNSEHDVWATENPLRRSFSEGGRSVANISPEGSVATTPQLSSSKSSPDLEVTVATPSLPPCPRPPSRIPRRKGWFPATDISSPPRPLTIRDARPSVPDDIKLRISLDKSLRSDTRWGFGRSANVGGSPSGSSKSSRSTGSAYSRGTDEVRSSNSSSDAQDSFHAITLTPQRLLPVKRSVEHSRSLPFLNRQVYSHSLSRSTLPPIPVLPSDLDAVYPDASLVRGSESGVDKIRASKSLIMGGLRNSFSKFSILQRKFANGTSPPAPPDLEKATASITERFQHQPKRSKDMFVIGDDSDKSVEGF